MRASFVLSEAIDFYLRTRRSLGCRLKDDELLLRSLARYARKAHLRGQLTERLVYDWACAPVNADPLWWARRVAVARRFARFWNAFDPRVQVPQAGMFGPTSRRNPVHIYTVQEISDLLAAAADLKPAWSLRPATFRSLFGLLACTGLRISEALHLQMEDFDPVAGMLLVRRSKGGQSRYVPLHASVVKELSDYSRLRHKHHPQVKSGAFFLSKKGRPVSYGAALYAFHLLKKQLGWEQSPPPRPHDLRHTFAVKRLITWQRQKDDAVGRKILALATYLGHSNIRDTYWYLSAVPELLAIASNRLTLTSRRQP
jgi:integrase